MESWQQRLNAAHPPTSRLLAEIRGDACSHVLPPTPPSTPVDEHPLMLLLLLLLLHHLPDMFIHPSVLLRCRLGLIKSRSRPVTDGEVLLRREINTDTCTPIVKRKTQVSPRRRCSDAPAEFAE